VTTGLTESVFVFFLFWGGFFHYTQLFLSIWCWLVLFGGRKKPDTLYIVNGERPPTFCRKTDKPSLAAGFETTKSNPAWTNPSLREFVSLLAKDQWFLPKHCKY
jgi:hypothetical protein